MSRFVSLFFRTGRAVAGTCNEANKCVLVYAAHIGVVGQPVSEQPENSQCQQQDSSGIPAATTT